MTDFSVTIRWIEPGEAKICSGEISEWHADLRLQGLVKEILNNADESGAARVEVTVTALRLDQGTEGGE